MKIAFVIYRNWAFEILKNISGLAEIYLVTADEAEFSIQEARKYARVAITKGSDNEKIYFLLRKNNIDVVFFFGWSWIVKEKILDNFLCICLHPSPLPKYRGGSPIQHQLINREKKSAVSVFKMTKGIDTGDVYMQLPMSLSGDINSIFKRMVDLGTKISKQFIRDYRAGDLHFTPQENLDEYPPLSRRKPEQSQILEENLKKMTFEDLYNLVRGLLDPFPDAHIIFNNKRISILKVKKVTGIEGRKNVIFSKKGLFLKLKDGFAKIVDYRISN